MILFLGHDRFQEGDQICWAYQSACYPFPEVSVDIIQVHILIALESESALAVDWYQN